MFNKKKEKKKEEDDDLDFFHDDDEDNFNSNDEDTENVPSKKEKKKFSFGSILKKTDLDDKKNRRKIFNFEWWEYLIIIMEIILSIYIIFLFIGGFSL